MREWREHVRERMPPLRIRPEREAEIVEELAQQLEETYRTALGAGADETESRARAEAQVADWGELARSIHAAEKTEALPASSTAGLRGDLRYALRTLLRNPAMTATAMVTLALGIGGCVAIYSLLDAVVLRPLEYRDPEQLVMVWEHNLRRGKKENVISPANYMDWRARNRVFAGMSIIGQITANVTQAGEPEEVRVQSVEREFLQILGVHPLLGRDFTTEDTKAAGPRVCLLGHGYWMRKFGGDGSVVGRTMTVDGEPTTIVGVLPAGFRSIGFEPALLMPFALDPSRNYRAVAGRYLMAIGRLRPAVKLEQAQREMSVIGQDLEREYPDFNKGWNVTLTPMQTHFAGKARTGLWVLMGAVGMVLLIACSNVANLLLVRAAGRGREMAIRSALGARSGRIVRQLLSESLVLAGMGGLLGCAAAFVLVRGLKAIAPLEIPRLEAAKVDIQALAFAVALTLATGLLFGLAPALAALRLDVVGGLREGSRGASSGVRGRRLRGFFVTAQVALSCVLLVGAGLLVRSFQRLTATDPGFETERVLTMQISMTPAQARKEGEMVRLFGELAEMARALPGVESASAITFLPFAGLGSATSFQAEGQPEKQGGEAPVTDVRMVEPRFFETMRIPLKEGRWFTDGDNRADSPLRLVISETMAREAFPGGSAVGRKIKVSMGEESQRGGEVIGVVGDIRLNSLSGSVRPMTYFPMAKLAFGFGTLVMRTAREPMQMAQPMQAAIRARYPDQTVSGVKPMSEWVAASLKQQRFLALLLSGLAGLSLVLAAVGLYGMLAYAVSQRTREIGVKLALGAGAARVRREVMGGGLRLAAIGLAAGLGLAGMFAWSLREKLEDVAFQDGVSYAAAAGVFLLVAIVATGLPAERATRVDPVRALREE